MKKLLTLILHFCAITLVAQSPQLINYQGVARDGAGLPVKNRNIGVRFEFRQGSAASPTVFTEEQNLTTNNLGLFNTQIGKINTAGMSQLNWTGGSLFLTVGIDTAGGTSYVTLGSQQLVSVPYAMHAESVPATYSNSILTVGKQSFTLSSASSTIDIQGGTNVTVGGAYPNYTVSSTPSLSLLAPNTLSISGGNTVDITPTLSLNGSVLSVGPLTNSITIPVSGTLNPLTGTATGISSVTTSLNSFTLNTPAPSFTNSGPTTITGTYPNYTINSTAASLTGTGTGMSTVTASGSNFTVNTPAPTFTNSGPTTISGSYPNFTVNSVAASVTGTGTGAASVTTSGSNFTVNVPQSSIALTSSATTLSVTTLGTNSVSINVPTVMISSSSTTSNIQVSGAYPNYTLSSAPSLTILPGNLLQVIGGGPPVTLPTTGTVAAVSTTVVSSGAAVTTTLGANSFSIDVPASALSSNGNTITLTQGTLTPSSVTVASSVNGSVTGGVATITNAANNFTLNVPAPALSSTGNSITLTQGTVVTTASVASSVNGSVTGGVATLTNTANNFTLNVPAPALSSTGNSITLTQGTVVTTASVASSVNGSVTGGVATLTNTANNFTLNVPPPALSSTGNSITLTQGTIVTTASVASSVNGSVTGGVATLTNTANNFTLNVPAPALSSTGNSITLTQGTVVTTASVASSVNGSVTGGIASLTNTANNFTLNVPSPALSSTGNSVTLTQGTVVTTASIPATTVSPAGTGIASVTNPSTNSFVVNVPSPALSSTGNSITLTQGTVITTASVASSVNGSVTGGIATLTNTANNFTLNVPSPALSSTGNSITLTQGTVVTTASVASSVNGSVTGGIATLTNTANNFTLNVPSPALSSTGNSLTLTQGTVVSTASIPATTVSPAGTGIASVTNPSTNSFVVNVPSPALSSTGNSVTLTQGTVVTTASIPATTVSPAGTGIASVTNPSTNSFVVNVPSPALSSTGNSITLTQGTVVTTASVASSVNGSVTGGIATLTNTSNNFTLNVPSPALSSTGNSVTLTQGTVVTTASIPATTVSPAGTGIASVTNPSTNSFVVNVPSPALSSTGNSVTLTQGTVVTTASIPATTVSPAGTGIASVTNPSTNSFVVNVPSPALSSTGNSITLTQGTVVTTASVASSVNGSVTGGIATLTNTANNFTLNVPSPALSSTGNSVTLTQGTVVTTASIPATTVSPAGTGIASVTNPSTNSFVVNVPSPALSSTGNSVTLTQGTVVTTASIPATTVSPAGTGIASVTNPSTNSFVVNVPSPALSSTSNSITLTQGTVVTTATVPAAITPSIAITTTGTGAAAVTSVGSSFSVNVPAPIFSNTGQNLITGTYPNFSVNTPTIANTSIVLTTTAAAGPSLSTSGTNSFNINIPPAANTWSLGGNAGTTPGTNYLGTSDAQALVFKTNGNEQMRITSGGFVGVGTNNPSENLQVETTGNTPVSIIAGSGSIANLAFGISGGNHTMGNIRYDNSTNSMNFWTNNTSNRLTITSTGSVGIGIAAANAPLQFANTVQFRKVVLSETANNDHQIMGFGLAAANILRYQVDASTSNHVFSSGITSGSSLELMRIQGNGRVGIGITAPSTTFAIGNGSAEKFNVDGTNGDMNFLDDQATITFTAPGASPQPMIHMFNGGTGNTNRMVIAHSPLNQGWGLQYQDVGDKFVFLSPSNSALSIDLSQTRVGVGTTAPTASLHVAGSTRLVDGTQGAGKILTSDASGNATWQVPANYNTGFSAYYAGTYTFNSIGSTIVPFTNVSYDDGGDFNIAAGTYTTPAAGLYHFDASIRIDGYTAGQYTYLAFYVNGSLVKTNTAASNTADFSLNISGDLKLVAGDLVTLRYYQSSAPHTSPASSLVYYFNGHRVY